MSILKLQKLVLKLQKLVPDAEVNGGGDLAMLDSTPSLCCFGSTQSYLNCCGDTTTLE